MSWQDLIKEALQYDVEHFSLEDIESGVASGDYQLWESDDSAMVTKGVNLQSGGLGVQILAASGTIDGIQTLTNEIETEARLSGVELLTTVGRKGWKKIMGDDWLDIASVYIKRLA